MVHVRSLQKEPLNTSTVGGREREREMARKETVRNAEELVERITKGNDASHDATHVWRVRDLALNLAREEGLISNSQSMEIVYPFL